MATAYGPSIVMNGLVLALDAANSKSLLTSVEVLVVGGGGGGGANHAGGGGGGGLIYNSGYPVNPGTAYTVTVGAGGSRSTAYSTANGTNGGNSVFGPLTAVGGGYGGNRRDGGTAGLEFGGAGGSGGGGGGQGSNDTPTNTGGTGTSGQGFAGGTGSFHAGAGGGGAGGPGETTTGSLGGSSSTNFPGDGGIGKAYDISGTLTYYAGGGGGGGFVGGPYAGAGGLGGGGVGQIDGSQAVNGVNGTGGGGGGANGGGNANGGNGGSGIVIIRYFGPARATGGTITSVGGYTIHTFTTVGSSTFTPNATWSDLSGNGKNATINGTYVSSSAGSLTFTGDGSTAQGGNIVGAASLLSSPNTVEFAVYTPTTSYQILTNNFYSYGESDRVYSKNGTTNIVLGATLNAWNIFSVTFNGVNTVTGYKNGILGNTSSSFDFSGLTGDLPIGARPWSPYTQNFKLGYIKIYNRELSVAEIQQNFNAIRGRYGL